MEGFQPVRLAYNTHEPQNGADENLAPIIYLHGLSAVKEYWLDIPQTVANATKRRSYSVDARNHGDSEWSDHFNFDINADDLIHFLDTLGIQKAILVGHSMGGMTAIKTALKRPDRVESIVVEDMYVRKCEKKVMDTILTFVRLIKQAVETAPADLDEGEMKKFFLEYIAAKIPPDMVLIMKKGDQIPKADIAFHIMRRDAEGRYTMKCNGEAIEKALSDPDTLTSEPEGLFDGPAFFIYGIHSPFEVGQEEQHIKQFFPNAVLKGIDTDHGMHVSSPDAVKESLLEVLS